MLRMLKQTTGVVLAAALSLPGSPVAAQTVVDPQLETGIRQVRGGDFEGAALTLDGVVRRLAGQREKAKDLARAYMYLSIAYLGLSQEATAKAKFLEAWKADPKMEISASEFPPKFLHFLEEARREAMGSQPSPPPPPPSPSAPPQAASTPPRKGGSKTIPLVLGAVGLVGAGIAVAAGGGGGGSQSAPPTTLPASVTGRWVGTGSDGLIITSNPSCTEEWDIALDLTQSGSNLTGTMTFTVRKVARPECPPPGTANSLSLSGTVASGSINFSVGGQALETTFTGTFTNTRMSGTMASIGSNGQPQTARWSVNRQ